MASDMDMSFVSGECFDPLYEFDAPMLRYDLSNPLCDISTSDDWFDSQHDSPINNDPERAKRRRKLLGLETPDVSPAASDTEATDTEMSNDLVRATTQLNSARDGLGLGPVPHRGIGPAVTNGRPKRSYMRPTLARLSRMKSLAHEQPIRTLQKSRVMGSVAANTLRKAHTTGIAFQQTKTEPQRDGNSDNQTSGEYSRRTDRTPGYAMDMPHHASGVTSQGTRSSVQTDVKGHGYISGDHSLCTMDAPQRGTNKQYYALDMQPPRAMAKSQSSRHMHTNSLRSTLSAGTRSRANPTPVHRQRSVDVQGKGMGEEMATSTSIHRAAVKNPRTHTSARATSSAEKSSQTDTYSRVNSEGGVPPSDGYAKQLQRATETPQAEVEVCAVRLLSKPQSTGIRTTRKDVECVIDSAAFKTWGEQHATQNTSMGRGLRRGTDRDIHELTQRQSHLTRTRTHHRETWPAIDVGSPTATSGGQAEAKAQEARTQPSRHTHTLRKTLSQPSQHTATHRDNHEYTRTLHARRMRSASHFAETGDKYTHKRTTDSAPDTLCSGAGPGGAGGRRGSNSIYSRGGCATNSRGSSPTKIQRIGGASTGLNTSIARGGLDGAGVNSKNRIGSCTSDSERRRIILETDAKGYSNAKTYPTIFKSHSTIGESYSITANTYSTTGNTYSTAKPVRSVTQVQRAKSLTDKRKSIDTSNQCQSESLPKKRAATVMHTMLQSNGRELSFKSQSKASKSWPGESKTTEKSKNRLSISERSLKSRESVRPADTLGAAPLPAHPGSTMRRCG